MEGGGRGRGGGGSSPCSRPRPPAMPSPPGWSTSCPGRAPGAGTKGGRWARAHGWAWVRSRSSRDRRETAARRGGVTGEAVCVRGSLGRLTEGRGGGGRHRLDVLGLDTRVVTHARQQRRLDRGRGRGRVRGGEGPGLRSGSGRAEGLPWRVRSSRGYAPHRVEGRGVTRMPAARLGRVRAPPRPPPPIGSIEARAPSPARAVACLPYPRRVVPGEGRG